MYLHEKVRKEDLAKQIAERDHIEQGLICILSVLERPVAHSHSGVKKRNRSSLRRVASVGSSTSVLFIWISA